MYMLHYLPNRCKHLVKTNVTFLPHDAVLSAGPPGYAIVVCLCVCLCVCHTRY